MQAIIGIDEAGRGAWAGPLVVGAVILGDYNFPELNDSKQLTKQIRQQLAKIIHTHAISATLGWVNASEIDQIGLTAATTLAIERALEGVDYQGCQMIIDGHINYFPAYKASSCLIKADSLVAEVSAASIIAKVARDEFMSRLADSYPDYGFDRHVGYGTLSHRQALDLLGLTDLHRLSFKPIAAYGPA